MRGASFLALCRLTSLLAASAAYLRCGTFRTSLNPNYIVILVCTVALCCIIIIMLCCCIVFLALKLVQEGSGSAELIPLSLKLASRRFGVSQPTANASLPRWMYY